mgnify:CR=1 FL=1
MSLRKAAIAALTVAVTFGAVTTSATAAEPRTASSAATTSAIFTQAMANQADAEFVEMMIPHHFQALVMGDMAPSRASDQRVRNLASRIHVEQDLEIAMMQGWQAWRGLPVTDAEQAYHHMMTMHPGHAEEMGMATQEQLDDLEASQGNAFDVMFLQLMITHHEGALDMLVDVMINGSDFYLQDMANEMLATQYMQILQMEAILADIT